MNKQYCLNVKLCTLQLWKTLFFHTRKLNISGLNYRLQLVVFWWYFLFLVTLYFIVLQTCSKYFYKLRRKHIFYNIKIHSNN